MKYWNIILFVIAAVVSFTWFRSLRIQNTPSITISPTPVRHVEQTVGVWVAWWDEDRALESLDKAENQISTISPVWYRLNEDAELTESPAKQKQKILAAAEQKNIQVLPSISNDNGDGFDPDSLSLLINDEEKTDALIDSLIEYADEYGYDGWDIDFEQVYSHDNEAFSDFIDNLADKLHKNKLKLSVTVHAKTGSRADGSGSGGQDWDRLSKSADEIRIMAYDFHYSTSEPGVITPLDKLEQVLQYANNHVPSEKLVLGLPFYGYNWVGKKGESVQYEEAMKKLAQFDIKPKRDFQSKELTAEYNDGADHTIWFQDWKSIEAKLAIAKRYNVQNIFFWRAGGEDPEIWKHIK